MLLPTMPAPMTTARALSGSSLTPGTPSGRGLALIVLALDHHRPPICPQRLLAPPLGGADLVERVPVEPRQAIGRVGHDPDQRHEERVRTVVAAADQPCHDAGVLGDVARRVPHANT